MAATAQPSASGDWERADITREVPGHPGVSYLDLLRQVVPDLVANETMATGHRTEPLRHIGGADYGGEMPDPVSIGSLQALTFEAEGKRRIALLAAIGSADSMAEQPVVLAVYDEGGIPKLVDAVDVGMDRFTGFGVPARVRIGPHDDALVTSSEHFNSSQSYVTTALIFLRNGRLQPVDTFSTFGQRFCGRDETQRLSFSGRSLKKGSPYYAITARVRDRRVRTEPACEGERSPAPFSRTVETVYRWNDRRARFEATSKALKRLEAANSERF